MAEQESTCTCTSTTSSPLESPNITQHNVATVRPLSPIPITPAPDVSIRADSIRPVAQRPIPYWPYHAPMSTRGYQAMEVNIKGIPRSLMVPTLDALQLNQHLQIPPYQPQPFSFTTLNANFPINDCSTGTEPQPLVIEPELPFSGTTDQRLVSGSNGQKYVATFDQSQRETMRLPLPVPVDNIPYRIYDANKGSSLSTNESTVTPSSSLGDLASILDLPHKNVSMSSDVSCQAPYAYTPEDRPLTVSEKEFQSHSSQNLDEEKLKSQNISNDDDKSVTFVDSQSNSSPLFHIEAVYSLNSEAIKSVSNKSKKSEEKSEPKTRTRKIKGIKSSALNVKLPRRKHGTDKLPTKLKNKKVKRKNMYIKAHKKTATADIFPCFNKKSTLQISKDKRPKIKGMKTSAVDVHLPKRTINKNRNNTMEELLKGKNLTERKKVIIKGVKKSAVGVRLPSNKSKVEKTYGFPKLMNFCHVVMDKLDLGDKKTIKIRELPYLQKLSKKNKGNPSLDRPVATEAVAETVDGSKNADSNPEVTNEEKTAFTLGKTFTIPSSQVCGKYLLIRTNAGHFLVPLEKVRPEDSVLARNDTIMQPAAYFKPNDELTKQESDSELPFTSVSSTERGFESNTSDDGNDTTNADFEMVEDLVLEKGGEVEKEGTNVKSEVTLSERILRLKMDLLAKEKDLMKIKLQSLETKKILMDMNLDK